MLVAIWTELIEIIDESCVVRKLINEDVGFCGSGTTSELIPKEVTCFWS